MALTVEGLVKASVTSASVVFFENVVLVGSRVVLPPDSQKEPGGQPDKK